MRGFILFAMLSALLYGEFTFEEQRYIYALDRTIIQQGKITTDDRNTVITYGTPPVRTIHRSGDAVVLHDLQSDRAEEINLSDNPRMRGFFMIIDYTLTQNIEPLKPYFRQEKGSGGTVFHAIHNTNEIEAILIEYAPNQKVSTVRVAMRSQDIITILLHPKR